MQNTNETKTTVIIFSGHVARELLKRGFTIIDIKPDRTNPQKSVFVFRVERDIKQHIAELTYSDKNRITLSNGVKCFN